VIEDSRGRGKGFRRDDQNKERKDEVHTRFDLLQCSLKEIEKKIKISDPVRCLVFLLMERRQQDDQRVVREGE